MTTTLMRNRTARESKISTIKAKRSIRPANWSRKQTMNASFLTPIMCKRVVPGDSWLINLSNVVRLQPQVTCPMDNLIVETFFFYCPDRLVWDNAPYFVGAIKDPNNATDYLIPQVEIPASANIAGSIFNYMGGSRLGKKMKVSSLPYRMNNLIYNEYFRDTDCESPLTVSKSDSDDTYTDFSLQRIHKSRDYFVNSTRDITKGAQVTLPLGTTAPVIGTGINLGLTNGDKEFGLKTYKQSSGVANTLGLDSIQGVDLPDFSAYNDTTAYNSANYIGVTEDRTKSGLEAILSSANAATLDAVRQAIMTEEYQEALNRSGNTYKDVMQNIYGITIPDLKISRPEYLGGTSGYLFTEEVIQQSGTGITDQATPQGNVAGYGKFGDGGRVINASFQEFGYIIGYQVVKAIPQYQQGLARHWMERDKYDVFNPYYVNASDQPIYRGEIYQEDYDAVDAETGEVLNEKVFGYIGRYDDLRYFNNEICGELSSEYTYSLDSWHYAEKFESAPENNADFMHDKTDQILERSMAVIYEDIENEVKAPQLITDIQFSGVVARPIPTHAVPKISALI